MPSQPDPGPPPEESLSSVPDQPKTRAATFTKIDNNLTSVGFFTASSKRSRQESEKNITIIDQGTERRISILAGGKLGQPITQDQDYWLALMKLVSEHVQQAVKLQNPFTFTTAALTKILGQAHSGNNYKAVLEWADVMTFTGIRGGAYNAAQKRWLIDRTHALDRFVSAGKELPNGKIADKNYVWFSEWQLDNINSGKLIPVELDTYIQLKTNIARNLVPHLQEWLFASQRDGRFEKQYVHVCQLLGIRIYRHYSEIERKLGPSLNELVAYGYISKWALEPMTHGKGYKLVFWPGAKYHTDRMSRTESRRRVESPGGDSQVARRPRQQRLQLAPPNATPAEMPADAEQPKKAATAIDETLIGELTKRGLGEGDARKLLARLAPGQLVLDQLEYADAVIRRAHGKIENPPGFYIRRLLDNSPNPPGFETSAARKIRQEAEAAQAEALAEQQMVQLLAEEDKRNRLDAQIDAMPQAAHRALFQQAKAQLLASFPGMATVFEIPDKATQEEAARSQMRRILAGMETTA